MIKEVISYKLLVISLAAFLIYNLSLITSNYSYAQPISSSELINNAKLYDGKNVTYAGEIIGDVMSRGQYAWINVNDGSNAIGIWIDKDLLKEIFCTGSYRGKGDWVEITGVFQRVCLQHGGDLDIHAQGLRKINSGRTISEKTNPAKLNFIFILTAILFVIWILTLLMRK